MSYISEVLADSPTAFWEFADPSGTSATDASPNSNPGTYTGDFALNAVGPVFGLASAVALNGSGTNGGVTTPAILGLSASNSAKSYEIWLKTTDTDGCLFYARSSGTTNPVITLCLGFNGVDNTATGKLSMLCRDTGGVGLTHANGTVALNDGFFHYVLITRSAGQVWNAYVDGNTTPAITMTDTMSSGVSNNNDAVGNAFQSAYSGAATCAFSGTLQAAAVYDTALSTARMTAHYLASTNPGAITPYAVLSNRMRFA